MESARKLVSQRLDYGRFTEEDEQHLTSGLVACLQLIPTIDIETAAAITAMIQGADYLKEPAKARLNDIIESKVVHGMPAASVCDSAAKIKLRATEAYQSATCWDAYGSNMADDAKLHRMAMQMVCLGMTTKWVDETTFGEAASLALHTTHRADMPRTRATEICGAICPECDMIEARPGCCIEPRGHENEHYCGKCGYSDTSDFWQGAMSDTSSSDTSSTSPPSLS